MSSTPRSPPDLLGDRCGDLRGDDSCATSVATRRSAACSSARRLASARASVFEIAVATSSVNWASRDSVSVWEGSSAGRGGEHHAPARGRRPRSGRRPRTGSRLPRSSTNGPSSGDAIGPNRLRVRPSRSDRSSSSTVADERRSESRCPAALQARHERHRVVGLEAHQGCRIGAQEPADLLVDRREQLVLRHAARDERRHAPERRLLLRDLRALGPRRHAHDVLAVRPLGRVVAPAGDDAPVAHAVDLAHRALPAQRPA